MLRSAVTGDELDLVDVSRRPLVLEEGDYVILASDGLHTLDGTEIQRIVSAYAEDGAEAVANALIRAVEACAIPHQDNTTVLAVRPLVRNAAVECLGHARFLAMFPTNVLDGARYVASARLVRPAHARVA